MSLRDDIQTAMETVGGTDSGADNTPSPAESSDAGVVASVEPAAPRDTETAGAGEAAASVPGGGEGRTRDPKGRFAAGAKGAEAEKPAAPPPTTLRPTGTIKPTTPPAAQETTPESTTETLRPPAQWRAMAREHWGKVPKEVRDEIVRRESEVTRKLQENSTAARFRQDFEQTVAPFRGQILAEGGNELGAVRELLQTSQALRTAPPAHKARLVANIVKTFGVPIDLLDSALAGQPPPEGQPQASGYRDPRVDELFSHLQQAAQQRQVASAQRAQSDIVTFADTHEFLDDVRGDMALLLEDAVRRGVTLTLEDAYNTACRMSPEVWEIFQQRQAAKAANARQASTQQALNAGSSVRTQPSGGGPDSKPADLREQIKAAMGSVGRR